MPINLEQLRVMLQGFNINILGCYKTTDRICYIEIISLDTYNVMMIYIPRKHDINIGASNIDMYHIEEINLEDTNDLSYENDVKSFDMNSIYTKINNGQSSELHTKYKRHITIDKVKDYDLLGLRSILRQLYRIKYAVEHVNYKAIIQYRNYITCINRHNELELFIINTLPTSNKRKLYIMTDFITLLKRRSLVFSDMDTIRGKVMNLLLQTNKTHLASYKTFFAGIKLNITNPCMRLTHLFNKNKAIIGELMLLLNKTASKESQEVNVLDNLNENLYITTGINHQVSTQVHIAEKKMNAIQTTKERILQKLFTHRIANEDIILVLNQTLFDSSAIVNILKLNNSIVNNLAREYFDKK